MRRYSSFFGILAGALALLTLVSGCDLAKMNNNPNATSTADLDALLANAQRDISSNFYDDEYMMRGSNLLAQYTTQNFYPSESTYSAFPKPWGTPVTSGAGIRESGPYVSLGDLERIRQIAANPDNFDVTIAETQDLDNYDAVAAITQTFVFHRLTDFYGDIPYTEALKGSENFSPAYTPQSEIYPALLNTLDDAIAKIDTDAPGPGGDVIYEGDMSKWVKFANSLKLRIAMRMVDANPQVAEPVLSNADVYADAMQSNADNAYFAFMTSAEHQSDIYENRFVAKRDDFDASDRFVDAMMQYGTNDPRMATYFTETNDGTYRGFPFGLQQADAQSLYSSFPTERFSRPGERLVRADAQAMWMNYDEVLFIRAEAADRGLIGGNPVNLLEDAMRASMRWWDADDTSAQANTYINAVTAEAGSDFTQILGEQKWIALYFQGLQGWSEWRRLDFEGWITPPTGGNQGAYAQSGESGVPLRYDYPQSELSVNESNVADAAMSQFGGSDPAAALEAETPLQRVWWDVNAPPSDAIAP
jgi:hypothetical protein